MAKRKTVKRRTIRRVAAAVRRTKKGYSPAQLKTIAMTSAGYGAFRNDLSALTAQVAGNIPFVGQLVGTLGDEAVLGISGYFIAKKMKGKLGKNLGLSMMAIESARVGEALRNGQVFGASSAPKSNSSIF